MFRVSPERPRVSRPCLGSRATAAIRRAVAGRAFVGGAILLVLVWCGWQTAYVPRAAAPAQPDLAAWLRSCDYERVPFEKTPTGQIQVHAQVNGKGALLLIDTGASCIVLDRRRAERFALAEKPTTGTATAAMVEGRIPAQAVIIERVALADFRAERVEAFVVNLARVNADLSQEGNGFFDGVIGADFLSAHAAVIDYGSSALYLRDGGRPPR